MTVPLLYLKNRSSAPSRACRAAVAAPPGRVRSGSGSAGAAIAGFLKIRSTQLGYDMHNLMVVHIPLKRDTKKNQAARATYIDQLSTFKAELGALGYPGFSYLRGKSDYNPARLLQLFRTLACHAGGRGFESSRSRQDQLFVQTCPFPIRQSMSKCISQRLPRVAQVVPGFV
jgi:hypothetical protein